MANKEKEISINKQVLHFTPDDSRVVTRFFTPGNSKRIENIFERIFLLSEEEAKKILDQTLKVFPSAIVT